MTLLKFFIFLALFANAFSLEKNLNKGSIFFLTSDFHQEELDYTPVEIFNDISNQIYDELGIKEEVTLFIKKQSSGASFDNGSILTVPANFYILSQEVKSFKSNHHLKAIIAHEYGHALLSAKINQEITRSNFLFSSSKELSKKTIAMEELNIEKKSSQITRERKKEIRFLLAKQRFEASRLYKSILSHPDSERLLDIIPSYQELYADLISYLLLEKPTIMSEVLISKNSTDIEVEQSFARSFYMTNTDHSHKDPHSHLARTRQFLGAYIEKQNLNNETKKKILNTVTQAIIENLKLRLDNYELDGSLEKINQHLIDSISKKL